MKDLEDFFLTKDGSLIHYISKGTGLPIVLLHGNNGNLHYFSHQMKDFSKTLKVYAIDSRDHGLSTNTQKSLSFDMMADDLAEFIENQKLPQVILLGFSDGANLAMAYALKYPQKVAGLILNGGNLAPDGLNFLGNLLTTLQLWWINFLNFFGHKMEKQKRIYELQIQDIGFKLNDLKTITAPTLVIVGQFDLISNYHSKKICRVIPNSQFIEIKGAFHPVAKQKPEIFNSYVLNFIKEKVQNAKYSE